MSHFLSRRDALLGLAAFGGAFSLGAFAADAGPTFLRGVSIWPWFGLTREFPPPSRNYAWPPFQTGRTQPTAADLANLRANNFDFVRIPMDAGPYIALRGQQRAELFAQLEQGVKMALAADLSVILNPQPNEFGAFLERPAVSRRRRKRLVRRLSRIHRGTGAVGEARCAAPRRRGVVQRAADGLRLAGLDGAPGGAAGRRARGLAGTETHSDRGMRRHGGGPRSPLAAGRRRLERAL